MGRETVGIRRFDGPAVDLQVLAAARHGVITGAQLRALGLTESAIDRRARNGRLHRVHSGVFAVGRADLTRDGRFLAAALSSGPRAAVSHLSAGCLWGLTGRGAGRVDVVGPRSAEPKPGVGCIVRAVSTTRTSPQ